MNSKSADFEIRLENFSKEVLSCCSRIKETTITRPLISQWIRSATSIGANYCEANNASSKKDFASKIYICKKESQETKYWIKLLTEVAPAEKGKLSELMDECQQFVLIFQKIIFTMKK